MKSRNFMKKYNLLKKVLDGEELTPANNPPVCPLDNTQATSRVSGSLVNYKTSSNSNK